MDSKAFVSHGDSQHGSGKGNSGSLISKYELEAFLDEIDTLLSFVLTNQDLQYELTPMYRYLNVFSSATCVPLCNFLFLALVLVCMHARMYISPR